MEKINERVNGENFDFPDLLAKGVLEIACRKYIREIFRKYIQYSIEFRNHNGKTSKFIK